jgi:hypothetical protein
MFLRNEENRLPIDGMFLNKGFLCNRPHEGDCIKPHVVGFMTNVIFYCGR